MGLRVGWWMAHGQDEVELGRMGLSLLLAMHGKEDGSVTQMSSRHLLLDSVTSRTHQALTCRPDAARHRRLSKDQEVVISATVRCYKKGQTDNCKGNTACYR